MQSVLNIEFLSAQVDRRLRESAGMPDNASVLQQRRRLAAAHDRLELGSYGVCCACMEPIPSAVLMADAASPFCADCQQDLDLRKPGR